MSTGMLTFPPSPNRGTIRQVSFASLSSPLKQPNVGVASLIMVASLFLSRVLGLVREAVIAGKFGANELTDAYKLSFSVPDLIFFLIAGGALSSAFIPVFSKLIHTHRRDEAWHVFSVVVTVMSSALIVAIALAMLFAEPLSVLVAGGKSPETIRLIAYSSRILLPAQFAFLIGAILFGTLYAHQRFAVPGLGPNVYNIGIIVGAVFLSAFVTPAVFGMSWGALVGAVIGSFVIPLVAMRGIGAQYRITFDVKHPEVKQVFKLMLPVLLGLSLPGVYQLIMQRYASFNPDQGFNSNLDYANRIMQAPLAVFGQSLALAVFPALSQFLAQNQLNAYRQQVMSTLRTCLFITLPLAAVIFVLAPEIVQVLFQRGAFTDGDTAVVARCLQFFCIGIPAWCLHPILMRAFFARQDTVTPTLVGTAITAVFFAFMLALLATPLEYYGLPLAGSLSAIVLAVIMLWVLQAKVGELQMGAFVVTVGKTALIAVVVAITLSIGLHFAPPSSSFLAAALRLGLGGILAGWVVVWAARLLKMPEVKTLDRALARLDRRKAQSQAEEAANLGGDLDER